MLALLLLLAAPFQTTGAPVIQADSTDEAIVQKVVPPAPRARFAEEDEPGGGIAFRPRFAIASLYSPNRGFGVGPGVGVGNLGWEGTDLTVDLRLQQHFQSADLAFTTADPYTAPVHVQVSAGASTTDRRRFYGLGPTSERDDEVDLLHDAAEAEVRLGAYPFNNTALYLQPSVRVLYDYSEGINPGVGAGTLARLDAPSREAVQVADGIGRYGLSAGLGVATDTRDWAPNPRRGLIASAEHRRFFSLDDSALTLARTGAAITGFIPIRGRTVLLLQSQVGVTRSGDADGDGLSDPIPFYYLPTLDPQFASAFRPDRLAGRDLFAAGVGVRAPVFDFLGTFGLDALVMASVGNAYDDLFEQFIPRVTFDGAPTFDANGRASLRPSIALGLGLVNLESDTMRIGGLIGLGPGGVTLATLEVTYDLRKARPLFR